MKYVLLIKSHVNSYTKKDGTFVQAHDDSRVTASSTTNEHDDGYNTMITNIKDVSHILADILSSPELSPNTKPIKKDVDLSLSLNNQGGKSGYIIVEGRDGQKHEIRISDHSKGRGDNYHGVTSILDKKSAEKVADKLGLHPDAKKKLIDSIEEYKSKRVSFAGLKMK